MNTRRNRVACAVIRYRLCFFAIGHELCSHYERALRTIIANPTKAAEIARLALDMGKA